MSSYDGAMSSTAEPIGRRERKKAATRKNISDVATTLFLERGFDNVSIREVADAADVSPTTVFAHFSQKEALVFDEDDEQRDRLVAAVRNRPAGVTINRALHDFYAEEIDVNFEEHGDQVARRFMNFLNETPALRDYASKMWLRHEDALAAAIADELGLSVPTAEIQVYSRFVLQMQILVSESDEQRATARRRFRHPRERLVADREPTGRGGYLSQGALWRSGVIESSMNLRSESTRASSNVWVASSTSSSRWSAASGSTPPAFTASNVACAHSENAALTPIPL